MVISTLRVLEFDISESISFMMINIVNIKDQVKSKAILVLQLIYRYGAFKLFYSPYSL